jgi:hypothetical protein
MSLDRNPFGKDIKYRKGRPIQLLFSDEQERIRLNEDALEIIRRLKEPVGVITVGEWVAWYSSFL